MNRRFPVHRLALLALLLASVSLAACGKKSSDAVPGDGAKKENGDIPPLLTSEPAQPAAPAAPARPAADTVLVTVNGEEITQAEIDAQLARMFGPAAAKDPKRLDQANAQFGARIQDQLIQRRVLAQAAKKAGTIPTDEAVSAHLDDMVKKQLPPDTDLDKFLAERGTSRKQVMSELRDDMAVEALFDGLPGVKAEPKPEEVRAFYDKNILSFQKKEQVKARHILLMVDKDDTDEAKAEKREKLEAIHAQLTSDENADFAALAKEHSACPSGKQGGDLGFFPRGQMVPPFDQAAFSMKPGELSGVVETQFGYHLIKVEEHKEAGTEPFEAVAESIKKRLQDEARRGVIEAHMAKLKEEAKIVRTEASAPAPEPVPVPGVAPVPSGNGTGK